MAVGSLSMIVPMYVAECAPPEVRGLLIGMQQFAIEFGIMISFWIDYGTNFWYEHNFDPYTSPNERTGVAPAKRSPKQLGSFQFVFSSHLPWSSP
ncbi:hypothetical protein LTR24_007208 [Lithohypha guttulata]|uniref:Major facilitator superfamily (MFS) profile domain-containing protein n=1 Tax=Lithohypha guttulata TaxID=1690604 RepID=A0ABR0K428_9EURO|nr:hypothetical protein LTR24_007208 [Lithohypha guttulata]